MKIVTSKVLKIWALSTLALTSFTAFADDADTVDVSMTFRGSVDTYFRTNLSAGKFDAPASSFANLNGFALGMVNIIAEQETEQGGYTF